MNLKTAKMTDDISRKLKIHRKKHGRGPMPSALKIEMIQAFKAQSDMSKTTFAKACGLSGSLFSGWLVKYKTKAVPAVKELQINKINLMPTLAEAAGEYLNNPDPDTACAMAHLVLALEKTSGNKIQTS